MRVVGARTHFDEHQSAVAVADDQVDLAAARMRPACDSIIARDQFEARPFEVIEGTLLGRVTESLRRHHGFRVMPLSNEPLLALAQAAAGGQQYPAGALYVVATPIGNLADLTLRAIEVLRRVDAVACEDTRVTAPLLRHLGLHKALIAADEHHERAAAEAVRVRLASGERVALVSDAGTPAISDPGARLIAALRTAGFRIVPVPGPSAVTAALSVAGHAGDDRDDPMRAGFRFVGFLPAAAGPRRRALEQVAAEPGAVVLYEAPHRIEPLAAALAEACGDRLLTVAREITKQFEQVETLAADAWPAWLAADADRRRGEFVVVLHSRPAVPTGDAPAHDERLDATLRCLLAELSLKQSAQLAAKLLGLARDVAYARALKLRDGTAADS